VPIFSLEGRVYWSETDAAQIAHFTSFLRWCEKTEEEFIVSRLGEGWIRGGVIFPRVHAECDYYYPVAPHERYRVDIVGVRVGRKSIEWEYEIHNLDAGRLAAKCRIVTVAFDPARGESVPVPDRLRRLLEEASGQSL